MSTKHQMNWEKAACFDFAANYHESMSLKSWCTKSDSNSTNICRDMPGAYYSLIVSEYACVEFGVATYLYEQAL